MTGLIITVGVVFSLARVLRQGDARQPFPRKHVIARVQLAALILLPDSQAYLEQSARTEMVRSATCSCDLLVCFVF